ncbi:MAG TPA: hypothetical protein VN541_06185 [Tepidisphaeraceae bacterium]|nr:hypothetical protein [Tepidisphaeraceae bacterium]
MTEVFDQSKRLLELWADMATKMASAGLAAGPDTPPPDAARKMRAAFLQALSQQADQFLRSPQFLEFIKLSLDSSIQTREQLNDFFTRLHHEVQGVARQDIDHVLAGIHQAENRIMDRLEEITRRLEDLSRRVNAMEDHAENEGEKPATQKRPNASRGK